MKSYNIVLSNVGEHDLLEIGRYISMELLEPELARKLVSKIGDAILSLERMPYRGALVKDRHLAQMGIRYLPVENYIVFYAIDEKAKVVSIARVLYSRRNWQHLLI